MKRSLIAIALSACLANFAAAKQLYNITLSDTSRYTDCSIIIKSDTETKFNGTDKDGNVLAVTVKNDEILVMAPVEKAEPAPQPKAEEQPKPQQAETQPGNGATPAQPAPQAQEQTQPEEQPAGDEEEEPATPHDYQAIADSLHKQLDDADKIIASITTPKFTLERRAKRARDLVDRRLEDIKKLVDQLHEAQDAAAAQGAKPFEFTIVTQEQRTQYETDGKAAYDAMLADMKVGKSSRRVGGLSKFEEMRANFQGVPEYKQARSWYLSTLKDLHKKWSKLRDAEDTRRRKADGARRAKMDENDEKDIEKVTKLLADENEKYETAWFTPSPHNAKMLENLLSRIEDVLRRSGNEQLDDAVGRVPEMLSKFWEEMDNAKALYDSGNCAEAAELLNKSEIFKDITRLNRNVFPEEYRKELLNQRKELEKAIRTRDRELKTAQRSLAAAVSRLDRSVQNLQQQIEGLMNDVEHAVDADREEQAAKAEAAKRDDAKDDESGDEETGDGDADGEKAPAKDDGEEEE